MHQNILTVLRAQDLVVCFLSRSQCHWNTAKADLLKTSGKLQGQKHAEVLGKEEQRTMLAFEGDLPFQVDSMYKQAGHLMVVSRSLVPTQSEFRTLEILLLFWTLIIWYCIPFCFWPSSQKIFVHPDMLTDGKDLCRTCVWAVPALRRQRGPCCKQGWLPLTQVPVGLALLPAGFTCCIYQEGEKAFMTKLLQTIWEITTFPFIIISGTDQSSSSFPKPTGHFCLRTNTLWTQDL